jgi:uncharacterized protein (TIGR02679 family)
VLGNLSGAGADLYYHGDLDWPGIAIANRVITRFGARPWQMTCDDYLHAVRSDRPFLAGNQVEPAWDHELGAAMRSHGRALHEETVLALIFDGLAASRQLGPTSSAKIGEAYCPTDDVTRGLPKGQYTVGSH